MTGIRPKRECVPLVMLVRETGLQMRAGLTDGLTDPATVERYCEAILDGDEFPPLDVVSDGQSYWLFDGFQRAAASERAGKGSVDCLVYRGSHLDALFRALGANARHGLTRTINDCRRALTTVLENTELLQVVLARAKVSGGVSRALATTCGVSKGLVAKVLEERGLRAVGGRLVRRGTTSVAEPSTPDSPDAARTESDHPPTTGPDVNPESGSSLPVTDLPTTSVPSVAESLAELDLEKARKALTALWNSCRALLDGTLAKQLLRFALHHKIPFGGEQPPDGSPGGPLSASVWWEPIRQIDAVLSDLAAVTCGGLDPEGEG